ncbi:MAG: hypothetical protein IKD66_06645 [Solobacterium sp.]|nr:hypothetical protein [Solobacterium sp.]
MNNPFRRKKEKTLDLTGKTPFIRCSICTGEKTGGYRDDKTGEFREIMCLVSDEDYREFYRLVGTDQVETIY